MGEVIHLLRLDNAKACREFLEKLRVGKKQYKVEILERMDGSHVHIDDATDEEIIEAANFIAKAFAKRRGEVH